MAESSQEMEAREKKELVSKEEKTVPARYFVPSTDIHETDDALIVVMEMPGVEKKDIAVDLENDVLRIDARIDTRQVSGASAALYRVQCRSLRAVVHPLE